MPPCMHAEFYRYKMPKLVAKVGVPAALTSRRGSEPSALHACQHACCAPWGPTAHAIEPRMAWHGRLQAARIEGPHYTLHACRPCAWASQHPSPPLWCRLTASQIEGRGNGIKTNIVNNVDIAKALERPPECEPPHPHLTPRFFCTLIPASQPVPPLSSFLLPTLIPLSLSLPPHTNAHRRAEVLRLRAGCPDQL
jgi:hypothetical protein